MKDDAERSRPAGQPEQPPQAGSGGQRSAAGSNYGDWHAAPAAAGATGAPGDVPGTPTDADQNGTHGQDNGGQGPGQSYGRGGSQYGSGGDMSPTPPDR